MMVSSFRKTPGQTYEMQKHTQIRWRKTIEFLRPMAHASGGLDVGDRSTLTAQLEEFFHCPFTNTTVDLDTGELQGRYDVVTCFEVLEHLFNPLRCLLQIKKVLVRDGRLYLSTPTGKPQFLLSPSHFHEFSDHSLTALIKRAGFTELRRKKVTTQPWWFYFTGIRPMLRGVFERTWLLELEMSESSSE